jgi:lipoyl(octanoyl) transferase
MSAGTDLASAAKLSPVVGQSVYLGRIDYGVAWKLQQLAVEQRQLGQIPDTLLLCEHSDVITVGRRQTGLGNVLERRFPVFEIERGGDVTYHGPGQLVGYPIVALRPSEDPALPFGEQDLHAFLRALEEGLIRLCGDCGIVCDRKPRYTGVWTPDLRWKLASLGVAVRRWVTSHGFALNVTTDLTRFSAINPCGMQAEVMSSLAQLGAQLHGQSVTVELLLGPCARAIGDALGRRLPLRSLAESGLGPLLDEARLRPELPRLTSEEDRLA